MIREVGRSIVVGAAILRSERARKEKGKEKRGKKRKEKKEEERRNKSPFNDFFFVLLKARARIDCAIKTRTGLSRRSKSSRRIVLGSASANSLGPSTRYLGPPPLPLDSLARGRKTATDHRNWFVKVGSQRLYTLTVTKVTGTVSTYFGAGIDVASISSRARYLAVPRFNPWRVTVLPILARTFPCLFENSDTLELTKANKFFYLHN